jgi:rubrerythrin
VERDSAPDVEGYKRQNRFLRERLYQEHQHIKGLREEVNRWRKATEMTTAALVDANDLLHKTLGDLERIIQSNGVKWLHDELAASRAEVARLRSRRQSWNDLARRATDAKAAEAQRARELDAVVEQLKQKLVEVERHRDQVTANAEVVVAQHQQRNERFRAWCERWYKGEVGAMEVIAGIATELGGNMMEHPSELDRRRAVEHARTLSLMNEATDHLSAIVRLLAVEGVPFRGTALEMVKDYIDRVNGREGPDSNEQ